MQPFSATFMPEQEQARWWSEAYWLLLTVSKCLLNSLALTQLFSQESKNMEIKLELNMVTDYHTFLFFFFFLFLFLFWGKTNKKTIFKPDLLLGVNNSKNQNK